MSWGDLTPLPLSLMTLRHFPQLGSLNEASILALHYFQVTFNSHSNLNEGDKGDVTFVALPQMVTLVPCTIFTIITYLHDISMVMSSTIFS